MMKIILKIPTNVTSILRKGKEKDVSILTKKKMISSTHIRNKQVVGVNLNKYAPDKEDNTYDF